MRKAFWPEDIEIWQGLEKDPGVRRRLEMAVSGEDRGGLEGDGVNGKGLGSRLFGEDEQEDRDRDGEREILELLERPRVMQPHHSDVHAQSSSQERPVSSGTGMGVRSGGNTHLRMRKGSVVDGAGGSGEDYEVAVSPVEVPGSGSAGGRRVFSFS